ncbi:MAG: twin-arginine translocation signal domain-containing protein [Verrucomicrobia bacterium]|nr:twin-arginine translocation signal domain-containing protein [Verrucomicrobiota bacterium]
MPSISDPGNPSRREFIKDAATLTVAAVAAPALAAQPAGARQPSLLQDENARAGSRDWQLTRVKLDKQRGFRSPAIEGYCSHQSIKTGETIEIMVSTKPASKFMLEVYRMGYYGGRGARLMTTLGPLPGVVQPDPSVGDGRLRECRWSPGAALKIPGDWVSGVYLGRLTTVPDQPSEPYWQSYVVFVVRDGRRADLLFQCSDNTWAAYNRWPDDYSLYTDPRGSHARNVKVSFDRPYNKYAQIFEHPLSVGSGEFLLWEFPLLYWLEQHGYDVTYCSNSDCLDVSQITRCKTFLSVGHDEYWDTRQYDAVKAAIDSGTHVLWLCGNSVFGVTPFSPSSSGRPNRIITRTAIYAGLSDAEVHEKYKDRPPLLADWKRDHRDESLIIGARNIMPINGGGDWVCTKPEHWIFEGTGMKKGDFIPGLVGWEHHGAPANIPGLEVVAEGTSWRSGVTPGHWTATVYPGPKQNIVFNAATIFWSQGLSSPPGHILPWSHWSRPHGPDERVQRIMRNVLRRTLA